MATKTLSNRGYRSSVRPEQLESRVMLSASPADPHLTLAPAHEAKAAKTAPDGAFDLGITGTEVQFSPIGTPAFMAGSVAYVTPGGHSLPGVGHYQETLTPIFMDVNGDLVPDFVGTQGVATFSFYAGPLHNVLVGSITTVNTSYIQGMTAAGEMLVGSTGTITSGSGLFQRMSGGFTSQSVVALFPGFAMQTAVHFVISDFGLNHAAAARVAGALADSLADAYKPELKALAQSLHSGDDANQPADKPAKPEVSDGQQAAAERKIDRIVQQHNDLVDLWSGGKADRWASDLADCLLGAA